MPAFARRFLILSVALMTLAGRTATSAESPPKDVTRIELVVDEGNPGRKVAWPVTTGVPFPQGKLTRPEQCRLIDDLGEEHPLQSRVAATWDAARSSIRWLTIDFIATPGRRYRLQFGPSITRREFAKTLQLQNGDSPVVDTGRLRVEFARRGPSALKSVCIDLNADGRITPDEQIAGGPAGGDHVFIDQKSQSSNSTRDDEKREIVVEQEGPVRSCVRVDGWYTGPDGRRIIRYRTRYHFFAGQPLMKVVDEFRIVGSTRDVVFRDIALPLELKLDTASRKVTAGWSDDAADNAPQIRNIPWNDSTQSVSLAQETYRHYGNLECRAALRERTSEGERTHLEGTRAGSWLQVADKRASITGSLRWFWQQFPKEWELTKDRLVLHLWSPRGGSLDFGEAGLREFFGPAGQKYLLDPEAARKALSPIEKFFFFAGRQALQHEGADGLGINKHHEAWFHFAPAAEAEAGRECGELADRPPLCLASSDWNVSTGVFGPLADRPNGSPYEAIVNRIFGLERYAQDEFGDYGWWLFGSGPHYSYQWDKETQHHYADSRRFEYHTYQRETQLWWCYLRSGERKFYDWAIPSENHWVDVAVSHVPTKYSTEWRGGAAQDATLTYAAGDWSIDSPLHYVRHHDTGEAWLRSAPQFWATYHRTLETTTLAYYLTGDERFADVVDLWRAYWGPLAGMRSDSQEFPPLHREQLWYAATEAGKPSKSWAEMLRDYAPFQSGSRHQMTLFFNLATLYEHTWDPAIGRVLKDYADAFLDPASPNGVWQCQDHRLPANADSPMLSHYWSPALWKYARASGDPRMPEILRKYFTAAIDADPYGGNVGIYSNVQIAWGWHFTRDPRHLVAARHELEDLMSAAAPLAKPEDLGPRIYNPADPIRALAAAPRLIGALQDAADHGIPVPSDPPLVPQRALIALHRKPNEPLRATTWGWDRAPEVLDAMGQPAGKIGDTATLRSHRQPFDRALRGFEVYRSILEARAEAGAEWLFLSPKLETGLLDLSGVDAVWCHAGEPLQVEPKRSFAWPRGAANELRIETAQPAQIIVRRDGTEVPGKPAAGVVVVPLEGIPKGAVLTIEARNESPVWFRLAGLQAEEAWVTTSPQATATPPSMLVARRVRPMPDDAQTFVPGRFGQGLVIVPGRALQISDEVVDAEGKSQRLSDQSQGTIEFWIRRLSDERLTATSPWMILHNGPIQVWNPGRVPRDEWTHIAIVWRPHEGLKDRSLVHIYVDGRDHSWYRNLTWEGYNGPPQFGAGIAWLKQFVATAPPGVRFILDDVRISSVPRYYDRSLTFGSRQTWNPLTVDVPEKASTADESTVIHLPLDGNTTGTTRGGRPLEARLIMEKR